MVAVKFDFASLKTLKSALAGRAANHVPTMNHYASGDGAGFWHQPSKRGEASRSSTATCVTSLVRAGKWLSKGRQWGGARSTAEKLLVRPWESADLKRNNPFTLSFIAEGVLDIGLAENYPAKTSNEEIIKTKIIPLLIKHILSSKSRLSARGGVSIDPYPPSAYLAQLAFRVVRRCVDESTLRTIVGPVRLWARAEMNRQIALISTNSRIADPMQLAYAVIVSTEAAKDENLSPEEKRLTRHSLQIFFSKQQPDGSWPPSQPIFHYPTVGNAHCFTYELLTQLLNCSQLQDELLEYLPNFELSTAQLDHTSYDLGRSKLGSAVGWASGHHPQIEGPESWSTACVYDFVYSLDRLVAEAIRRALFSEFASIYTPPEKDYRPGEPETFAESFLDAPLQVDGTTGSLRDTLRDRFVIPISRGVRDVASGRPLPGATPMSAILFGPPGTSKTKLATLIAKFLGWPLLSVDPSYLVQDGMEHLYTRANHLFSMLAATEQVVVLLDEFDEMGRDREGEKEMLPRLITTSMLPKLADINEQRKIVFLLATNFVGDFDTAFSRPGRFDMRLQVMPPKVSEKINHAGWEVLKAALDGLREGKRSAEDFLPI